MYRFNRPEEMSNEEFTALIISLGTPGKLVSVIDDEVTVITNTTPERQQVLLDNFSSTAPRGIDAIVFIVELPKHSTAADFIPDSILRRSGCMLTIYEAAAQATHILGVEFRKDGKGYSMAGTLDDVYSYLEKFTKGKIEKKLWTHMYKNRRF